MKFRLYYRGKLKSNGSVEEKHELRKKFHVQLERLWSQKPLHPEFTEYLKDRRPDKISIIKKVGDFIFAPLVCEELHTVADIEIIFLRPEEPGLIVTQGGDIDNRIKTLLDALRMPKEIKEIPKGASPSQEQFYCLLEDDALITHLSVTTDRLLDSSDQSEVVLIITVIVRVSQTVIANISLIGN